MKPTRRIDPPLGPERKRALRLLADHWTLWLLLAIHERDGARFSDLADEPGLSRRVLSERLQRLVDAGLVDTERYQNRPVRVQYGLTARGRRVRDAALELVHAATAVSLGAAVEFSEPIDRLVDAAPAAADAIYREAIAPIVAYDQQYGTHLVETLTTYFDCEASVSVTAARMHAHRHTIRYRLDRIRELTNLDVEAVADRERLLLGLRAQLVR